MEYFQFTQKKREANKQEAINAKARAYEKLQTALAARRRARNIYGDVNNAERMPKDIYQRKE